MFLVLKVKLFTTQTNILQRLSQYPASDFLPFWLRDSHSEDSPCLNLVHRYSKGSARYCCFFFYYYYFKVCVNPLSAHFGTSKPAYSNWIGLFFCCFCGIHQSSVNTTSFFIFEPSILDEKYIICLYYLYKKERSLQEVDNIR